MCLKLGYSFKKGKFVRVKKSDDEDDDGDHGIEAKGLLSKEIQRWKKQQETLTAQAEEASTFCSKPSKCNRR